MPNARTAQQRLIRSAVAVFVVAGAAVAVTAPATATVTAPAAVTIGPTATASSDPAREARDSARDEARRVAAARAARYLARGGAPRWGDSGHPIWAKTPCWIREVGLCIRRHESVNAGHYQARNPVSSASGSHQFTDQTWRGNARHAKWRGKYVARRYARAVYAPAWVQDVVFIHAVTRGGLRAWHGTGCPGT